MPDQETIDAEFSPVSDKVETLNTPPAPKRGGGFGVVLFSALIAVLFGGAAGFVAAGLRGAAPVDDTGRADLTAQLANLEGRLDALEAFDTGTRLSVLEAASEAPGAVNAASDPGTSVADELRTRVEALEAQVYFTVVPGSVEGESTSGPADALGEETDAPPTPDWSADIAALQRDLARTQEMMAGLRQVDSASANDPAPAASPISDALLARLEALEAEVAASASVPSAMTRPAAVPPSETDAASNEVVDALQQELSTLRAELATARANSVEPARVAMLENALNTLSERVAGVAILGGEGDPQRRLALRDLDAALQTGRPFADVLANWPAQSGDARAVNTLRALAGDGVRTRTSLREELARWNEVELVQGQGAMERLRAAVGGVVVRPDADDTAREEALDTARAAMATGDLAGAVRALEDAPLGDNGTITRWLAGARARLDAEAALRQLSEQRE